MTGLIGGSIIYNPEPLEKPAPGNVLLCCSQPNASVTLDGRAMGAKEITPFQGLKQYDATRYQGTQVHGGTIIGSSPDTSVVNPYLQHWQLQNLFVLGGSVFPQKPVAGPTLTILAQTLRTADAVIDRYLKQPSSLA
jgi:gluconate 2-dehydrogenase alpha chain